MKDIWHAKTYTKFLDLRTKPAQDLLFAIPASFEPEIVYDLGCGPGNSTILLKDRWNNAKIIGVDSSADMLSEAKKNHPELIFLTGDIAHFNPEERPDVIFSNAAIQWVGNHEILIPHLLHLLNPHGVLAIQIPNNFHCPSHQVTVQLLKNNPSWQPLLQNLRYGYLNKPFYDVSKYYDILSEAKATNIQIWETEYLQEVGDYQGIFNWVQGTGLRPILSVMDKTNQMQLEKDYVELISKVYPLQANGKVLLPYRRLFMVAQSNGQL